VYSHTLTEAEYLVSLYDDIDDDGSEEEEEDIYLSK